MIFVDGDWMYRMHGNQVGFHSPRVYDSYTKAVEEASRWNEAYVKEWEYD